MAVEARTYTAPDRETSKNEVFTPRHLIDKMIAKMPGIDELEATFFEPAAGDGNIVIAILEHKLNKAGWSLPNALLAVKSIYACEYMKDNRDAIVRRVGDLLIERGLMADRTEYNNSAIRSAVRSRVAYCNTIDPWDTSEGRSYPKWLITEVSPDRLVDWSKKSKFYKENKDLWAKELNQAKADLERAKRPQMLSLDDL